MKTIYNGMLTGLTISLALGSGSATAEFDIQGIEVGQSHENFKEVASGLVNSPDELEEQTIVFLTQARRQVEESAHVTSYSFQTADSKYRVELARKPLDESVKRINRTVEYNKGRLEEAPSLAAYTAALKEKYGEPVVYEEFKYHSTTKGVKLTFTDNSREEKCPENVINSSAVLNWGPINELDACGTVLQADVNAMDQPSDPVFLVRMTMYKPAVVAEDERGYEAYWNQWMQDYLAERGASGKPTL
ncbi:hypothetical protein [Marinobacter sp. ATCH36]|uniref:hypothetical protein n=1 Tax=Marinobacter sp. ATCH36 TaxID=2945106 RepID=UPI002020DFDD|nr:hypothetical protein [Marinobacter sp. ATCH36]MCL7944660.1 hypothetical protein [Marinobacter sp. ATCH36]